jgi:hypothetical protein
MNDPAFAESSGNNFISENVSNDNDIKDKFNFIKNIKKTENIKEYHKNYKKGDNWKNYFNDYVEKNKDVLNAKKREDRKIKKDLYDFFIKILNEKLIKFTNLETFNQCERILNRKLDSQEDYLISNVLNI